MSTSTKAAADPAPSVLCAHCYADWGRGQTCDTGCVHDLDTCAKIEAEELTHAAAH